MQAPLLGAPQQEVLDPFPRGERKGMDVPVGTPNQAVLRAVNGPSGPTLSLPIGRDERERVVDRYRLVVSSFRSSLTHLPPGRAQENEDCGWALL